MNAPAPTVPPGWSPDADRVARLRAELEAKNVTACVAVWTDVYGAPKAKVTPLNAFEKMCAGAELYTVGAVEGMGLAGPHEDECAAVPDLNTLALLPHDPQTAWFHADLYHHGVRYAGCGRGLLQRAVDRATAAGYDVGLGIEPECYVYRLDDATGEPVPATATRFAGPNACYDLQLTAESRGFMDALASAIADLGWGLYSYDQECGRGQHEFDFGYADALTSADRLVQFRYMARNLAAQHGLVASFMPKPWADDFRSGAHLNLSLTDRSTGQNAFRSDAHGPGELAERHGLPLSDAGYRFAAGVLHHAGAVTAVTCPTYNSYQGLVAQGALGDFSWAPVLVAYGDNNRSAMLRCPLNRPCLENRAADIALNPYLAAAMMLHAGLDGIEHERDPGTPLNDDLYRFTAAELKERGIHRLPPTLLHAADAFEASDLARDAFGGYHGVYLAHLHREWERFFYDVHPAQRRAVLTRP